MPTIGFIFGAVFGIVIGAMLGMGGALVIVAIYTLASALYQIVSHHRRSYETATRQDGGK